MRASLTISNIMFVLLSLFGIAFSGCDGDSDKFREGAGHINPEITFNSSYIIFGSGQELPFDIEEYMNKVQLTLTTIDGIYSNSWESLDDFPRESSFLPGDYLLSVSIGNETSEGVGSPFYFGCTVFTLEDGATVSPLISCEPESSLFRIRFDETLKNIFSDFTLLIHSKGGTYINYSVTDSKPVFILPGTVDIMLNFVLKDGKEATVSLTTITDVKAGYVYDIDLKANILQSGATALEISYNPLDDKDNATVLLDSSLFENNPEIRCIGFISGEKFIVNEGVKPPNPLKMVIENKNLRQLNLSANWLGQEVNVLKGLGSLNSSGIEINNGDLVEIDFTNFVTNLRNNTGTESFIVSLQAVYENGTVSEPSILDISLQSIDIEVLSVSPIMTGIDMGKIIIKLPDQGKDNISMEILNENRNWVTIRDIEITESQNGIELAFYVPRSESQVYVRILYCDEIKATIEIPRNWPKFNIEVDAFAMKALVKVLPEDDKLLEFVASAVSIYADGEKLTELYTDEKNGIVCVSGLEPAHSYKFTATLHESPSKEDFTSPVTVTTEKASDLNNGDFEDLNDWLKYDKLPSGGRYSQNIVEIFNQQNFKSFFVEGPVGWSSVNSKTFCNSAKNKNTWYMAPSTESVTGDSYSLSRSVKLTNVGWDVTGEDIPDYLQTGLPYTTYSLNIPTIKYKAVGKLFLGSYYFDPNTLSETYNEGVSFSSRPSALNGAYKFLPVSSTQPQEGYALVEIIGKDETGEIVIARGEAFLQPATGFTAFTIPLEYNYFGIKASKAKVMFAASSHIGTIEEETEMTVTIPDPVTSVSTGNMMWIDGISFSY